MSIKFQIARIVIDVPIPKAFDYVMEEVKQADIGKRVIVPFGRHERMGVIVDCASQSDYPLAKLKPVLRVLDEEPVFTPDTLALLKFCSQYYQFPLGGTIFTALPARLRQLAPWADEAPYAWQLTPSGKDALGGLSGRAKAQIALRDAMSEPVTPQILNAISRQASSVIKKWAEAGWIESVPITRVPCDAQIGPKPYLTEEQARIVEAVDLSDPQASVLFGVTGSGKTEVYLRLVEKALAAGKQVLVLVPEINLTPQLLLRFKARFPHASLTSLHSEISDAERAREWMACRRGERSIVLGTRLSVFVPLPALGLILIDEEHDNAYKQQDGLRYSAKHVALMRGKLVGAPVLLGSATPSLESWFQTLSGKYRLHTLSQRAVASAVMPTIALVDTRRRYTEDGLSSELISAIQATLDRKEQSLLFINRRGYAPVIFCDACGWQAGCDRCSARLVLHRQQKRLVCHHCGWGQPAPLACPDCGNQDIKPIGVGTQRLEDSLEKYFPTARILRIDRDAMRHKGSWAAAQARIAAGEVDILVGTQMLAKGHDFPDLTLVGVVNADASLYAADFRASERLFAQLMQVSGRAGRAGKPGQVLVQTAFPEHPVFDALIRHDYAGYATSLLQERADCAFPPYTFQALLRAEAPRIEMAMQWLHQARQTALSTVPAHLAEVTCFDPVPALMARIDGKERAQLLFQSDSRAALQRFLSGWSYLLYELPSNGIHWSLEVDPIEV